MKESKAPSLGRTPAQKFLDKWQGLIYLIPWIIGFIVFKAIPFGQSLYYSFTDMNFFNGIHQYGVMNYVTAFSDAKVTKALVTTFKYAFVTVPLKLIFALFIAYILNFKIACVNLFRTVYYIPSILGGSVAIAVLWKAVFRDDGHQIPFRQGAAGDIRDALAFRQAFQLPDLHIVPFVDALHLFPHIPEQLQEQGEEQLFPLFHAQRKDLGHQYIIEPVHGEPREPICFPEDQPAGLEIFSRHHGLPVVQGILEPPFEEGFVELVIGVPG